MRNNRKPTEDEVLDELRRIYLEPLPSDEELEDEKVSPLFVEKMHRMIDEESAKQVKQKHQLRIRWIGMAAAIILILLIPYYEVIAEQAARYIFLDYNNQFVIKHVADWEKPSDYSSITYTMPNGFEIVEEMNGFIYAAHWRKGESIEVEIGVSSDGVTHFDYEYANQIEEEVINGTLVKRYSKFGTTVLFGIKDGFLVDVSGNVEYSILKEIFITITFE